MPTTIFFAGDRGGGALSLTVVQDPEVVAKGLRDQAGLPVTLELADERHTRVYVNPAQIAYWHAPTQP